MYQLFVLYGKMPGEYLGLPYFEQMLVRSFLHVHFAEEEEAYKKAKKGGAG